MKDKDDTHINVPYIDVSDWGGPDIPSLINLIESADLQGLQNKLDQALWQAFADGANAFVEDLAIELHENGDICLYETAGFNDVATIPADKMQASRNRPDGEVGDTIMIKDYLSPPNNYMVRKNDPDKAAKKALPRLLAKQKWWRKDQSNPCRATLIISLFIISPPYLYADVYFSIAPHI